MKAFAEVAAALRNDLENLYSGRDPSFLWDPSRVWDLLRLVQDFEEPQYRYVGREGAEKLYGAIMGMEDRHQMQVLGAKGTGKTTVVSTISGYLIGSGKKRVVYISAKRFFERPAFILKQGLLVACGNSPSLLEMSSLEELECWCLEQTRGSLMFVVDDWDELEAHEDSRKYVLYAATTHCLVKVSSGKSRDQRIWCDSDKVDDDIRTEFFDGPYTSSEMDTWVAQSGLTVEQLQHVDRLTGGIPGLLRFYEESKGNEQAFQGRIRGMYTVKLFDRFIGLLTTREQLRAALELLMYGELSHDLAGVTDLSCFYKDKGHAYDMFGNFRPLSPYLRSQAEYYIMEQHQNLESSLLYKDMEHWVQAVQVEAEEGKNPARISWDVEALVIAIMRFQKRVFALGYTFKHYRRYEHGSEVAALNKLTIEELAEGVLLGPLAFNEKAVDVIHVILVGEQFYLTAIQIMVAPWKARSKESHKVWKDEVVRKWSRQQPWTVNQEFCYIMPESVQLDDVSKLSLGHVHECLKILDDLDLKEPTTVVKGQLKKCSGRTASGERCNNGARVLDEEYYCHYHHHPDDVLS